MHKIIWTKENTSHLFASEKVGHYRGCEVHKTASFYWVFWSDHVSWAAPHSQMSDGLRSAQAAKAMIDRLLAREETDLNVIVRRHEVASAERDRLWKTRGYKRNHLTLVKGA